MYLVYTSATLGTPPPPSERVEVGQPSFRIYNRMVCDDDTNLLVKTSKL
jgi:hypothetical protein